MRGRRKGSSGGFLTFSSKVKCNLPAFSVWKELPGDTHLSPKHGGVYGHMHGRNAESFAAWLGRMGRLLRENPENRKQNEMWN